MTVDIAFSLNKTVVVGLLAAMNSIILNTAQPNRLRFNIAVPPDEIDFFKAHISQFFPSAQFEWRVHPFFPPQFLQDYIQIKFKRRLKSVNHVNSRYMQYARIFLKDIFDDLGKVIYLDMDLIVLKDLADLLDNAQLTADCYLAAVPHFYPAFLYFGKPLKAIQEIFDFENTFNSGVLVTDFNYWNEETQERLHYYLQWDAFHGHRMLNLGDETLLNVMFKHYYPLAAEWNCCGYGNLRPITWLLKKNPSKIGIIHWSGGHHKPWKTDDIIYSNIWRHYGAKALDQVKNELSSPK